jgi:hypothetical protein
MSDDHHDRIACMNILLVKSESAIMAGNRPALLPGPVK